MQPGVQIDHVVVLMLENRSFDSVLGRLYPPGPDFDGLKGNESNPYLGQPVGIWPSSPAEICDPRTPSPDPGELFADMNFQLFSGARTADPPAMTGFVENYMQGKPAPADYRAVMHAYPSEQLPVITTLAKSFAVCDQWHAAAPCQTWPNRFFAHTGTCLGNLNNSQFHIPFTAPSIFRRLSDCDKSWRVYFHDVPQSLLLGDIWLRAFLHYRFFKNFLTDAANGALPNYSFIEPRYFTDLFLNNNPNDEHPPSNILYGEQLIAQVYNALRASSCWRRSLLIITFDEHGGCFDHAPPPVAVPPDAHAENGFAFDRYGVRVPAVLVSPWVAAGSRLRSAPEGLPFHGPPYPFDHTSIIKTLRILFNLGPPLTARDAAAPDLLGALSLGLNAPNDGPASITPPTATPTIPELLDHAQADPNHMQSALTQMAHQLPPAPLPTGSAVPGAVPLAPLSTQNVAQAQANSVQQVRSFLAL